MGNDDSELAALVKRGSPDAADELFRRHWPGVWRAAFAICGRRELADDLAQEAFVRALSSVRTLDENRPIGPWIRRIAVNAALDELRRERRELPNAASDAGPSAVEWDRDERIVRAVAALAPERRLVVVLHYWLDYETPVIAELLELPLGTVASRLSRALSQLRLALEAEHV